MRKSRKELEEWRKKWAQEAEEAELGGGVIRQSELPEGDTIVRLLTYDPPVKIWTHWFNKAPFHCTGDKETLRKTNGWDPENCRVCQWAKEEGKASDKTMAKPSWLLPCSMEKGENRHFTVLEVTKGLFQEITKIAVNSRNDILSADLIITKEGGGEFPEYSADLTEDSEMTEEEIEWMESAMSSVEAVIPALDDDRFAELTGMEEESEKEEEKPKRSINLRRPEKRKIGV